MESTAGLEQRYIEIADQYRKNISDHTKNIEVLSRKIIHSGWLRVLIFVLLFAVPIYIFEYSEIASITLLIGFGFCFGILIKRSNKYRLLKSQQQFLLSLNKNELKASEGNWSEFDSGNKFIDPLHNYSHDLDLFGEGSFFQYINRTATLEGENNLHKKLCNPSTDSSKIISNQEDIKDLQQKISFRQIFFAKGKLIEENQEILDKITALDSYEPLLLNRGKFFKILMVLLPTLLIGSITLSISGMNPSIPIFLFLFNLGFIGTQLKKINKINLQFSSITTTLKKYAVLTQLINDENFSSENLIHLQNQLKYNNQPASSIIKKLSRYMNNFDQRNGMISGPLLNGLFLWDFVYVLKIEKWLFQYALHINKWFEVVHELDALNSMAGFAYNHPDFVFPVPDNAFTLKTQNLGHPLLNRKERICNDFDFKESIFSLITGANMSGKSTFLRTVGLNIILARCGMTVCAKEMFFKPMKLVTNMRTTDSLMKHESYFFAELKRLKFIIDSIKEGQEVFIILDEILKGTNSKDKTYGSMELIKNLLTLKANGMIATHDLELGILEKDTSGKIINQCFEVKNTGNELLFDYKLYPGITQNHNATYLMKQMGIIAAN